MNWEVFITCAVTGAGDTAGRSPLVPVAPEQIADAAIEAARAGAAIAHIHVRNPETGKGARDPELYRQVVERVRAADVDVVLNLTAGMGGDLGLGGGDEPLPPDAAGTDMAGAEERLHHVAELRPEIVEWARDDDDLESLRVDPDFRALVGATQPGSRSD